MAEVTTSAWNVDEVVFLDDSKQPNERLLVGTQPSTGEVMGTEPMKVDCMLLEAVGKSPSWGDSQIALPLINFNDQSGFSNCIKYSIQDAELRMESDSISRKAVHWGSADYIINDESQIQGTKNALAEELEMNGCPSPQNETGTQNSALESLPCRSQPFEANSQTRVVRMGHEQQITQSEPMLVRSDVEVGNLEKSTACDTRNQDQTPVHVVAVTQPVRIELPRGFLGTSHVTPSSFSLDCSPNSEMLKAQKVETTMMQLGPSTPKLTAARQEWGEIENPCYLPVPHQNKVASPEEESTNCSGSDPEPLTRVNSEGDSWSGSEHKQIFEPASSVMNSPSESTPAPPPGLQLPPMTPSIGSRLHGTGMCQPCAWFWKPNGCTNEGNCEYCHLCPQGELKTRKKAKIVMMRLGLSTPKSTSLSGELDEEDNGISELNVPGFHMLDSQAPKEELLLSNLLPPGLQQPAGMLSHGSLLHGTGNCKPCAWFWKSGGCQKQQDCTHCHICPGDEIKTRKNAKLTMMRLGLATPKNGSRI